MDISEQPHEPVIPPPRFFFAVSLGAAVFFLIWTWIVHPWAMPAPSFDDAVANHWQEWSAANPKMLGFMIFLTDMGGIAAMVLLSLMGSIWQTAIKHRTLAFAWLGIMIGGALINQGAKEYFNRPRPPNHETVVHERNASYPSGHAMGSLIGYAMLGYALVLPQRHRPRRIVAVCFMIAIIAGVGFSRMYLRAHWFGDVIGGWSLGLAWVFLCIGWLERYRRRPLAP